MFRYIKAMSMSRSDLGDWIDNHAFQVMVALAQLYLFPSGNRVHWRKEVWEKFSRMYKLKNNKLPNAKFIFNNSWNRNKNEVANSLQYAMDKESEYKASDYTLDEFYQITQDYFLWVSDKLSQNSTLVLQDVKDELDRLGLSE